MSTAQLLSASAANLALETASCVWLEIILFAVAATSYAMYNSSCCLPALLACQQAEECEPSSPFSQKKVRQAAARPKLPAGKAAPHWGAATAQAPINLQATVTVIRNRGRAGDLKGAIAAFKKALASGTPLTAQVHNCLIDAHLQCNNAAGALEHFWQCAHAGTADIVTYNTVLKALLGMGRVDEAESLRREMAMRGFAANRVTFHEFLHAKVVGGDQQGMWKVIDDMEASGITADAVTCAILAKSLKQDMNPANMKRVMKLVADVGGPVDEVLLSSVIEACIRTRRLDMLSEVMRKFEGGGHPLNLTPASYGSLIKAYGHARDVARMWELWKEMVQRGLQFTAVTLGCMLDALVRNGCVDQAQDLMHEVYDNQDTRFMVNTVMYSTILKGLNWEKQIDRIFTVYDEMVKRGIACNVISFNTMIDACARCGAMDRLPSLLEGMRASGVEPDLVTYSTLVKGYSMHGDVSRGFKVLDEMKANGKLLPDEILCNSLLDGCAREHRVDDALRLLQDMKASGVSPSNCTISILVKLLGRARRLDEAFQAVEELSSRHGFRPNIQVYTCLIQACLHNYKIDRALAVHETMAADANCKPDAKAYSVLVRGCLQLNAVDKAVYFVECAYKLHGSDSPGRTGARGGSVPGIDAELLVEVVARLRSGTSVQREVACTLASDLKTRRGLDVANLTFTPTQGQKQQRRTALNRVILPSSRSRA